MRHMDSGSSSARLRGLVDGLGFKFRGIVASEANMRRRFRLRELWQPAEIAARKRLAGELAAEVDPRLVVDPELGYLQLPREATPDVSTVCEIGRERQRSSERGSTDERAFRRNHLARAEDFDALLKFGLDRRLLAMISHYLGVVPVLANVDFLFAFTKQLPFKKSQLWHCDPAADREVKLFVCCDAVTRDDGPLTVVPASHSRRAREALRYRFGGKRYRIADAEMDRVVPGELQIPLVGGAGTVNAVDTISCFHYGSRIVAPDRHRIVAVFVYCPPSSTNLPRRLASGGGPLAHYAANYADPLARAVLGVPVAE